MENKFYSLEIRENNKLVRVFQVIFGAICISVAGFWVIFNLRSIKTDSTLWITVAFLCGFGVFQILSGVGYTGKFIEFSDDRIRLKKNSLLPVQIITAGQIEKTDVYPLKLLLSLRSSKKILIRFGVTDPEKVELVKDEMIRFASRNSIATELKNE